MNANLQATQNVQMKVGAIQSEVTVTANAELS